MATADYMLKGSQNTTDLTLGYDLLLPWNLVLSSVVIVIDLSPQVSHPFLSKQENAVCVWAVNDAIKMIHGCHISLYFTQLIILC